MGSRGAARRVPERAEQAASSAQEQAASSAQEQAASSAQEQAPPGAHGSPEAQAASAAKAQLPRAAGQRPRRPRAVLAFIHLFLLVQIALPVSYYLTRDSARAERYDERFAWRMFSAERMVRCQPVFLVGEKRRPVRLYSHFHEAWVTIARRGRRDVLEAMARRVCRENPGQPVYLELTCQEPARPGERPRREVLAEGLWNLCPDGRL